MRNEDPAALQLYKTVLANLKQIDDHSISSHRFIIKVYTSIAHVFIELERNENAWDVIQQMGHDINEWNDPINVRLLQSSDFMQHSYEPFQNVGMMGCKMSFLMQCLYLINAENI